MKHLTAVLSVLIASAFLVAACSKNNQESSSTTTSESAGPTAAAMSESPPADSPMAPHGVSLPIPLAKLPGATVPAGNASAGAKVFAANCASCHGEGGKNGQVGPTLYGAGLKANQVAYMVRSPQGVDKSSGMPKLPLTAKEVADVSAYVASLK